MTISPIEEIKNRLNIVEVIGSYIKLTKTGINYRGLCPFHSEKKPSFFVSPARQIWHCFGCLRGGDIFKFIMEIEGIDFGDALRILAQKAGVEIKREDPQVRTARQRLYEICELACAFFEKQLAESEWGKRAKEYLQKRGISSESIKKWRLGYSPDVWYGLSDFLVGKGYKREEVVKAGLAVSSQKGSIPYDRFRGRIIFPIFDINSQVIGFAGRVFKKVDGDETAKYINTPQSLLYDKSRVLYGLNNAKISIRKKNECVIVEGYTDTILAHQAGFDNTVSVSGTALTSNHLDILKRYADSLVLAFDMDVAGDSATQRGIHLAQSYGFNIRIIERYEKEKDPADIIVEDPAKWQKMLEGASSIMEYYFNFAFSNFDKSNPQDQKKIGAIILSAAKRLQSKIEQAYWVQRLAQELKIKDEVVFEELQKLELPKDDFLQPPDSNEGEIGETVFYPASTEQRKKLLEERIVFFLLKEPKYLNLIDESYYPFLSPELKRIITRLKESGDQRAVLADFSKDEGYKSFFVDLKFWFEIDEESQGGDNELRRCLASLKEMKLREDLDKMCQAIQFEKDEQKREFLIKEFNKKAKELHQKI